MITDEMTIRALLAASAAERQGFYATADAFFTLARDFIFEVRQVQPLAGGLSLTAHRETGPEVREVDGCRVLSEELGLRPGRAVR